MRIYIFIFLSIVTSKAYSQFHIEYSTNNSKLYTYSTELKIDTLTSYFEEKSETKEIDVQGMSLELSAKEYDIFHMLEDNVCIMNRKVGQHLVTTTWENCNDWQWKITNEQEQILGYTTYKAQSASKGIIAWFCPDIPISAGPYLYNGLPGLILKAYDPERKYVNNYKATKITQVQQTIPEAVAVGIEIPDEVMLDVRRITKKTLKKYKKQM